MTDGAGGGTGLGGISGGNAPGVSLSQGQSIIQGAGASANTGSISFFANDPYNQYKVFMGGVGKPKSVLPYQAGLGVGAPFAPGVLPLNKQEQQKKRDADMYLSYGEAVLAPRDWDEQQLKAFVNKGILNKVPGFDVGMGLPQIQSAWQNMVQSSIMLNQGLKPGQKPWSPMDVMDTWGNSKGKYGTVTKGDWVFDVATGERIKYVGPTTRTTTSKNINLSSPEETQALVTQVLREALGRGPTAKELAQFKSTISGYEQSNPEVTTTTSTLTPDLATGEVRADNQSSVTTGGVTDAARAALVNDTATQSKEYGKYQGATTYFGALMQMLGGS